MMVLQRCSRMNELDYLISNLATTALSMSKILKSNLIDKVVMRNVRYPDLLIRGDLKQGAITIFESFVGH